MKISNIVPSQPLDKLAVAGRIGVIALSTDFNIEMDLQQLYPEQVSFFTSRVKSMQPLTIENLRKMEPDISATAATIIPDTALDVMIYACTSGTIAIGAQRIAQLIHQVRPGIAVTNPVVAALAAFDYLQAKRICLLTPYTQTVNQALADYFVSCGLEVVSIAGFGFEDDTAMTFISPQDIYQAALDCFDSSADLLFISCTALRATQVLDDIEQALGVAVLSSNQVLAWHSLRLVDYPNAVTGFGSLLSSGLGRANNH